MVIFIFPILKEKHFFFKVMPCVSVESMTIFQWGRGIPGLFIGVEFQTTSKNLSPTLYLPQGIEEVGSFPYSILREKGGKVSLLFL